MGWEEKSASNVGSCVLGASTLAIGPLSFLLTSPHNFKFDISRTCRHPHSRWKPRGGPSTKEPCQGSITQHLQKSGNIGITRFLPKIKRARGTLSNDDRSLERRQELYEKFEYRGAGKRSSLAAPDVRKLEAERVAGDQE